MNSFDTKFYSLDTNVIKVDSCTNKLLVFNAETYISVSYTHLTLPTT